MVTGERAAPATGSATRDVALFASTYLTPIVGFPLVTYAWWRTCDRQWPLVVVIMGVPLVFGYLMPGIATHVLKRWRFTSGPRLGAYYVHHGFIYAAKLALMLLFVFRSFAAIASVFDHVAVILVAGAASAFGGWWHDVNAVRAGRIEVDGGPDALATFAPPSYFSMGATYAGVVLAARAVLVDAPGSLAWVFPAALLAMCGLPTLVFLAVDAETRDRLLRWRAGGTLDRTDPTTRGVNE
jgi:hypothetical protein